MINGLCDKCQFCIVHKLRECEWDMFEPIDPNKSKFYTASEFDCVNFLER